MSDSLRALHRRIFGRDGYRSLTLYLKPVGSTAVTQRKFSLDIDLDDVKIQALRLMSENEINRLFDLLYLPEKDRETLKGPVL